MDSMRKLFIILMLVISILMTAMTDMYADAKTTESGAVIDGASVVFTAKVGELKKITFKLTNNVDKQQPFVYIIQVKNPEDIVDQPSWVQGVLQVNQQLRPQQSWIPEKPGEYTVEIFIWECITQCQPLSPVLTMKVIVEP